MKAHQERAQSGEVALPERSAPLLLDLSDDLPRLRLSPSAALRETDQLRPPIGGIRNPLDVAQALEAVHEVDDRGLGHLGELRELGDA